MYYNISNLIQISINYGGHDSSAALSLGNKFVAATEQERYDLSKHSINFPSQAVSDIEKLSEEYGLKVARAIRHEWFSGATSKYNRHKNIFQSNCLPN